MQIFIRGLQYQIYVFNCNKDTKIQDLKNFISKKVGLPRTWQKFIMGMKVIFNERLTKEESAITNESTLYLMLKWHGIGCDCICCLKKPMLLRNGKRLQSLE